MVGPKIPYGLDPHGNFINIEEAEHKACYYKCIECEEFLIVRQGDERAWHFAHSKGDSDLLKCSLRTEGGVEKLIEKSRETPEENRARNKRLCIIITKNPYDENYSLFGLMPPLTWDDLQLNPQIFTDKDEFEINSNCIAKTIDIAAFRPNEPDVIIPLNPQCSEFNIEISTKNKDISRAGNWKAAGLQDGDIFIGDENKLERSEKNIVAREDDFLIIIFSKNSPLLHKVCLPVVGEIGNFTLFSAPFNEETRIILENLGMKKRVSNYNYGVDVILPPFANPNPILPVFILKDSTVLLGITPSKNLNPEFEIISIPYSPGNEHRLAPNGNGIPRYYIENQKIEKIRKISVHWGFKHTLITLFPYNESYFINFRNKVSESQIIYQVNRFDGSIDYYSPLTDSNRGSINYKKNGHFLQLEEIHIINHGNFPITIYIGYKNDFGLPYNEEYYFVDENEANSLLQQNYQKIPEYIEIELSNLGIVSFIVQNKKKEYEISEDEIKIRIQQKFVSIPKKVTNSVVKSILGISKGSGNSIPSGSKKRIRNVVKKMKNERGKI